MIQLIVAIFAIGLCVVIAQNVWKYGGKLAGIVVAAALAVVAGIPALLGIFVEKMLGERGLRRSAAILLAWGISFFALRQFWTEFRTSVAVNLMPTNIAFRPSCPWPCSSSAANG